MKKIWIDGFEANVSQRLGSGKIAFEVIKTIEKLDHQNDYSVLLTSKPLDDLPKERDGFHYKIIKPTRFKTIVSIPLAYFLSSQKPDVIFSPTHYIPRFIPKKIKKVVTIFDLSYLYYPQFFTRKDLWQLKRWSKYSIQNSNHIITISKVTKKDMILCYKIPKDRITVCYPGYDSSLFKPIKDKNEIDKVLAKYEINGNYIIYIGTIQPKKNLIRLIEAVARVEKLKLVIVGKSRGEGRQGWMFQETLDKPKELGIEDRVTFTGFAPSSDLPYLISGSLAYFQPSLYEGFGLPVVEAMACGVPVAVSNTSSLPEVVGKAGLLFDPLKVDQIEQAIRTITTDKKLWIKLSKQNIKQAKKYSYLKMTRKIIKILENV